MKKSIFRIFNGCSLAVLSLSLLYLTGVGFSQVSSLVSNSSFETGGTSIGQDYNQNGWTFFVIEEPVEGDNEIPF